VPKKPNSHGDMQEYVPAGNGDASGEYGNSEGSNKHFTAFKKPKTIKPLKVNRNDVDQVTIKATMGDKVLNFPVNSVEDFMERVNATKQETFTDDRKLSFQIKTKDGNVIETEDFNNIKDIKKYFSNFKDKSFTKEEMLNKFSEIKKNAEDNYNELLSKTRKETGLWDTKDMSNDVTDKLSYFLGKKSIIEMLEESNKFQPLKANQLKREIEYRKNRLDEDKEDYYDLDYVNGMYDSLKELEKFIKGE